MDDDSAVTEVYTDCRVIVLDQTYLQTYPVCWHQYPHISLPWVLPRKEYPRKKSLLYQQGYVIELIFLNINYTILVTCQVNKLPSITNTEVPYEKPRVPLNYIIKC